MCNHKVIKKTPQSLATLRGSRLLDLSKYHALTISLPDNWSCFSIILGKEFQIQNIDNAIAVQICAFRKCGVITHSDCHCIKLINLIIIVDVTSKQGDDWHGMVISVCQCY